jgi:hypothetical protein
MSPTLFYSPSPARPAARRLWAAGRAGEGAGGEGRSAPTAVAVGYIIPPAPRADFFNELLTQDTGLFLPPENANSFICNRSLSLPPLF